MIFFMAVINTIPVYKYPDRAVKCRSGWKALDLMSSWQSHIPGYIELDSLTGLGMNEEEMSLNLRVNDRIVHDINCTPSLPFSPNNFTTETGE